jgi:plastocyanin
MMKDSRWALIACAVVLAAVSVFLAASCGGDGSSEGGGGTTTVGGVEANDHGTKDVSGESMVEVELDDDYFSPTVLEGTPGQRLTLELKNEGSKEHNLTISELKIDQDIEGGETANVEVTLPESGTLSFFCKYHRAAGMAGAFRTVS